MVGPTDKTAPDQLISNIKNSIADMQTQMQSTYQNLGDIKVSGKSIDNTVEVIMTATYGFIDINFGNEALQGGVKEFKTRIRESWENVVKKIQETTQAETMKLLQQMQIPDEIRNMSIEDQSGSGEGGEK